MHGVSYRCEICRKQFKRKFHLRTHERVHSKEKPYKCSVCGRRFSHKCSMDRHQMLHSTSGGFFCSEPLCGKRFTSKDHLETHVKAIHWNMKPYSCEICDQRFAYKHVHAKHVARFHTAGDAEKKCEQCDKKFNSSSHTCVSGRRYSDIKPRIDSTLEAIADLISAEGYNPSAVVQMSCKTNGNVCPTFEEFVDEKKPNVAALAAVFVIGKSKDKQEKCISKVIKQEGLNLSPVNLHNQAEQVKFIVSKCLKRKERF